MTDRVSARPELPDLLTCELPAFCAAVLAALPAVEDRFGTRKVYISALWSALDTAGYRITLAMFQRRLIAARAAGLLELARADLVAAMPADLVAASTTYDLGAEYHFVVDRSARDPWAVDASPVVDRIPVIGGAS
jgi:hypothetical protein